MRIRMVLDARMWEHSGIGVYIRNLVSRIGDKNLILLIESKNSEKVGFSLKRFLNSAIYSIKEQIIFPFAIPSTYLFWSPHYNVPIFPIRACKRVVTIHDAYHLVHYRELSFPQKIYSMLLMMAAVRLSDRVITVSEFSKREIVEYCKCDPAKIAVIHNGVKQENQNTDLNTVRLKYNLPEKYLLFVGNVKRHKNIRKVLQALLLLDSSAYTDMKVVVVGKKDGFITGDQLLFEWIEKEPIIKEKTIFTGFVTDADLDGIYQLAQVFIFPSLYEGFGLPPLEAMLNGCPVLASSAASIPEVCGEAALYFDPTNATDLKNKIIKILSDQTLRTTLIAKGKERVREFTWEKSAEKHLILFNSLVGDSYKLK